MSHLFPSFEGCDSGNQLQFICRPIAAVVCGMRMVVKYLLPIELNWMALVLTDIFLGFSIGT
jgi:hypothetical protein